MVELEPSTLAGAEVARLSATDSDSSTHCPDSKNCPPCAHIIYEIVKGNHDDLFWINDKTGELFTKTDLLAYPGHNYRLIVAAYNSRPGEDIKLNRLDMNAYTMVRIDIRDIYEDNDYTHINGIKDADGKDMLRDSYGGYEGNSAVADGYSYDEPQHRSKRVSNYL